MKLKPLISDIFWGLSAAALALLVRWALDPLLGTKYPYATAFVFIAITAWRAGPRAAVCMLIAFYPAANYFFVEPRGAFSFDVHQDAAGFAINILSAAVLIFLGAVAKRTQVALGLANERLGAMNEEVAHINRELTARNDQLAASNEELQRTSEQLAETSEHKDKFLTTLSHELRNPMSAIVVAAQMLSVSKSCDENSARAVNILSRQTQQMKGLLDDLLDKRRIALGRFELKPALVDIRTCIEDGVESNRHSLDAKNQKLKVTVPQTPVYAVVDARRITQIVTNIVGNATKHTNELTAIDVSLIARDGEIVISVRDNGPGISANALPHLFEPFHPKKRRPNSGGDGLGIGLTLTKGLVELHGGTITVSSAGVGTEFTIKLPVNVNDSTREAAPLSRA